jgi:hypothetical protein
MDTGSAGVSFMNTVTCVAIVGTWVLACRTLVAWSRRDPGRSGGYELGRFVAVASCGAAGFVGSSVLLSPWMDLASADRPTPMMAVQDLASVTVPFVVAILAAWVASAGRIPALTKRAQHGDPAA